VTPRGIWWEGSQSIIGAVLSPPVVACALTTPSEELGDISHKI
jgi:hypothetical protein